MTIGLFIGVAIAALLAEYMDASIGMGYGTTLTPLLLIVGFAPLDVVPAVLLGQLAGGVVGGYFHHRLGNIHLDFRHDGKLAQKNGYRFSYIPRSLDAKVILTLAVCGVVGAIIGVLVAINIPAIALRVYIGVMVTAIGLAILVWRNHQSPFSFQRLVGVGLLSAFNKGVSGGGYGPLVTGGQVLSGRETRNSVGSTTVAEIAVTAIGFTSYTVFKGGLSWLLVAAVSIGSITAGPLAAHTVKRLGSRKLKLVVGLAIIVLGLWSLAEALLFA
ncbi:MAG: sulfite exporter TauE/SafE family protein [Chloroflexi bacterium]|nr:sulfite exporter TauE/SafE family protein [Chloroflexota bacterium]